MSKVNRTTHITAQQTTAKQEPLSTPSVGFVCRPQDECGGTDGDDVAIGESDAILVAQDVIHEERAGSGGCIAQEILQLALLVALHANDAMSRVDAGVDRIDGGVDVGAQHLSPYHIVAHAKWQHLFEVEHILHNHDAALLLVVLSLVEHFFFLCGTQFGYTEAYGKLFTTVFTLKDQLLTIGILCFIEGDETIAFRTTYTLHRFLLLQEPSTNKVGMLCLELCHCGAAVSLVLEAIHHNSSHIVLHKE